MRIPKGDRGPKCRQHKKHTHRMPTDRMSDQQKWCGTWFSCGRGCTILYPSVELRQQQAAQKQATMICK